MPPPEIDWLSRGARIAGSAELPPRTRPERHTQAKAHTHSHPHAPGSPAPCTCLCASNRLPKHWGDGGCRLGGGSQQFPGWPARRARRPAVRAEREGEKEKSAGGGGERGGGAEAGGAGGAGEAGEGVGLSRCRLLGTLRGVHKCTHTGASRLAPTSCTGTPAHTPAPTCAR